MAVTIYDVASLADVGIATVSRVLNDSPQVRDSTRQRVLVAIDELGYRPGAAARSLVSGRSHTIAFVLCQSPDRVFADAFLPEVLRGVGEAVSRSGLRVLLHSVEDPLSPDAYIDLVREDQADGIILSGPRSDDCQLATLLSEDFPIVLLGQLPGSGIPSVDVDNERAAERATSHLVSLGHTAIGMITNAPLVYTASRDRLAGYRRCLEAVGIPYREDLVEFGDFREESGRQAMDRLLDLDDPPSAVFVASDLVAFGAMESIKRKNLRIPDDIALIGFDDVQLANYVDPPLTTMQLPARDLGFRAAQLLTDLLAGQVAEHRDILLDTELVVRQSCGANQE